MPTPLERQPDTPRIIAQLSAESQVPVDDVAALYEHERVGLAAGAHFTKFLHIFAIRNVQEILSKRLQGRQPPPLGSLSARAA